MSDENVFDWDDDNTEHIARHGVEPREAEEAVGDPGRVTRGRRGGRLVVIGTTEAGRVLVVLDREDDGVWRVVTARDSSQNEKRSYRRRRR